MLRFVEMDYCKQNVIISLQLLWIIIKIDFLSTKKNFSDPVQYYRKTI